MTKHEYGLYDRVLDWFSDRRMELIKGAMVLAVVAMVGGILLAIVAQL